MKPTRENTLAVVLVAVFAASAASAETAMRCSHQLPPANAVSQIIDRWAEEIETLSDGEIDVQIFGANSLVGAEENILAVAKGDIECAFSVQFQWGRTLPIMTITTRPYSFVDLDIWRNWHGSDAANLLEDKMRKKGVQNVVWLFQTNESVLTSNDGFLKTPDDFKGLKFRGLVPSFNAALEALGAAPVSMPGGEVYQALATGVIDGAMTGLDVAVSRKHFEVQDYFTITPVISVYFHGYLNPKFYASLSDKAKAALEQAGAKAAVWAVDAAEAGVATAPTELVARGAKVYRLTDDENAAFEAIMQPAFDDAFKSNDPDSEKLIKFIDQLRSAD